MYSITVTWCSNSFFRIKITHLCEAGIGEHIKKMTNTERENNIHCKLTKIYYY